MTRPDTAAPAAELSSLRRDALALRQNGQNTAALEVFAEIRSRWPQDARNYVDLAISHRDAGQVASGIEILVGALSGACRAGIWRRHSMLQLSRFYHGSGDVAASRRVIEDALTAFPDDAELLIEAAKKADTAGAKDIFARLEALLAGSPGHPQQTAYRKARLGFEWSQGDAEIAIRLLIELTDGAADADLTRQLIGYLSDLGRHDQAMSHLQNALIRGVLRRPDEKVVIILARILRCSGKFEASLALTKAYLKSQPDSLTACLVVSALQEQALDFDAALATLEQRHEPAARLAAARMKKQTGALAEARNELLRVSQHPGTSPADSYVAWRHVFLIDVLDLNMEGARRALDARSAISADSYMNQLHADIIDIFTCYHESLAAYHRAESLSKLCEVHEIHENTLPHLGLCCASWIFMESLSRQLDWRRISLADIHGRTTRTPLVPRVIMQYWDQPDIPADVLRCMNSWRQAYPDHEYKRLDRVEARAFLEQHFEASLLRRFDQAHHPAMRSDIIRMAWLFIHGGFYIDADIQCTGLSCVFELDTDLLLAWVPSQAGEIQNEFIRVVPGNKVIARFLENILSMPEGDFAQGLVWWVTGPGHMTQLIATVLRNRLRRENLEGCPPGTEILSAELSLVPKSVFEMTMFSPKLNYKSTSMSWQRARSR